MSIITERTTMSATHTAAPRLAGFTTMEENSASDWALINQELKGYKATLPDRIMQHLKLLDGDYGGFPIDRLTHCTQTATRALQNGEDEEYVVCALLHDVGDTLGVYNHPDVAATILQPFVSEANYWMVKHHGIFQGYYFFHHFSMDRNMREKYRSEPHFEQTERFVRLYDAPAFDPAFQSLELDEFMPMLRRVFSKPRSGLYAAIERFADGS